MIRNLKKIPPSIRRRASVEREFLSFLEQRNVSSKKIAAVFLPDFIHHLDAAWCVEGKLVARFDGIFYPHIEKNKEATEQYEQGLRTFFGNRLEALMMVANELGVAGSELSFTELFEGWMLKVADEPAGILLPSAFAEGDAKQEVLRKLLEKQRRQQAKREKLRQEMTRQQNLEQTFAQLSFQIKADLLDSVDFQFPKVPQDTEHFVRLRKLMELWSDAVFSAGFLDAALDDVQPVVQGCAWITLPKFFRALRREGETDLDLIGR